MANEKNTAGTATAETEAGTLKRLDPAALRFFKKNGALHLTIANECSYPHAGLRRIFPLSDPEHYWSVRDGANQEIGVLADPARLDASSRSLLDAELARRYFLPVIRRVRKVSERFGTLDWEVETDRGACRFSTRELRNNVRRLPGGRFILQDVEGNRFDVPNLERLDWSSQAHLLKHL